MKTYKTSDVSNLVTVLSQPHTSDAALGAFLGLLGVANPLVGLAVKFGVAGLLKVISTFTGPEITDQQIEDELGKVGLKVVPFDPATLLGK